MTPRAIRVSSEMAARQKPSAKNGHHVDDHGVPNSSNHATADGHAIGEPRGHHVQGAHDGVGRDEAEGSCRNGDTDALHADRDDRPEVDGGEVTLGSSAVHDVDHRNGERTHDHGKEEASHGQRHGHGDGRGDSGALVGAVTNGDDHENCRCDRRECGVGGDGSTNVSPAKGHHLERTAQDDASLKLTAHQADERACDQRLVELPLVQNAFHAGKEGNDDNQDDCECRHASLLLTLARPARTWPSSSWSRSSPGSPREPCARRTRRPWPRGSRGTPHRPDPWRSRW